MNNGGNLSQMKKGLWNRLKEWVLGEDELKGMSVYIGHLGEVKPLMSMNQIVEVGREICRKAQGI